MKDDGNNDTITYVDGYAIEATYASVEKLKKAEYDIPTDYKNNDLTICGKKDDKGHTHYAAGYITITSRADLVDTSLHVDYSSNTDDGQQQLELLFKAEDIK